MEWLSQVDRKTVRRYVTAAVQLGLQRDGAGDQLTDVFVGPRRDSPARADIESVR